MVLLSRHLARRFHGLYHEKFVSLKRIHRTTPLTSAISPIRIRQYCSAASTAAKKISSPPSRSTLPFQVATTQHSLEPTTTSSLNKVPKVVVVEHGDEAAGEHSSQASIEDTSSSPVEPKPRSKVKKWKNQFTTDFITACNIKAYSDEEFQIAFHDFDSSDDGYIDVADVTSLVRRVSKSYGGISDAEETQFVEAFMKRFDADHDGRVTWPEFHATLREIAEEVDPRCIPIAISTLVTGVAVGAILPVMPLFAQELGIAPAMFGVIVSAMGASRLLSNIPMAVFAERLGRKPVMVMGWAGTAVSMAMIGSAYSVLALIAGR